MSNIKKAFEHGKAFIAFVTCGDPSLETTEELVLAMEHAGADLIELGIPFSDPTAIENDPFVGRILTGKIHSGAGKRSYQSGRNVHETSAEHGAGFQNIFAVAEQ